MNKMETLSLIQLITTYYPSFKFAQEPKEVREQTLSAWHGILAEYDVMEISKNLIDYVKTGTSYPPVVGQLLTKKETSTVAGVQETMLRIQQEDRERAERQKLIQSPQEQEEIKKLHEQKRAELNLDWNRG